MKKKKKERDVTYRWTDEQTDAWTYRQDRYINASSPLGGGIMKETEWLHNDAFKYVVV